MRVPGTPPGERDAVGLWCQAGSRRKIPTAQMTISSMIVQPTKATMAAISSTEPEAWRESLWRIPSNGPTNTWLRSRMPETSALPVRASSRSRTIRRPITIWIRPKMRTATRRASSPPLGRCVAVRDVRGSWSVKMTTSSVDDEPREKLVDGPGRHGGCPGWGPAACPPPAPSITNTRVQRWGGPRVRRASPGSVGAYGSDPLTAAAATGSWRLRSASSNSGPAQPGQAHVNSMPPAAAAALSSDGHTWLVSWVPHLVHVRTISISHLLVLASLDSPVWSPERNGSSPCTRPARPLHLDPDRGQVLGWRRVAEGLLGADGVVVSPGPRWVAPHGVRPDNDGGRTGGFLGGEFCDPEAQIERLLLLLNRSI